MEKEHWFLIISAIFFGGITVGSQFFANLGFSLFETSFYRTLFIALMFLPAVLIYRRFWIKKEMLSFFAVYGLIFAIVSLTTFGGAVFGVPVAVVAFLLYSQPIWTTIFSKLMLKEQITLKKMIAVCFAIAGVFVLLKPWDIKSIGSLPGIICALLAGVFLSLWIIWGRKSSLKENHPITTTFGMTGFGTIWLIILWPILSYFIHNTNVARFSINFPPTYFIYLILFAALTGIITNILFFKGVKKIQASVAGIILLIEPVSATILAAILFSQAAGLNVIAGGFLILLSNYIIINKNIKFSKNDN
mgnify:CR=1 FL=1